MGDTIGTSLLVVSFCCLFAILLGMSKPWLFKREIFGGGDLIGIAQRFGGMAIVTATLGITLMVWAASPSAEEKAAAQANWHQAVTEVAQWQEPWRIERDKREAARQVEMRRQEEIRLAEQARKDEEERAARLEREEIKRIRREAAEEQARLDKIRAELPTLDDAYLIAKRFAETYVKANFVCPTTADFPFFDYDGWKLGDSIYVIGSYVDAENRFGARMRTTYIVTVKYLGPYPSHQYCWRLDAINFYER